MSDPEIRASQYSDAGHVFAATAVELGRTIPADTITAWGNTMVRLSVADSLSEQDPECFTPEGLLEMLDLDTSDRRLNITATNLLNANVQSIGAKNVKQHFRSREEEALCSTDLLRLQAPKAVREDADLWDQLGGLAVVGIHVDDLLDAREDAVQLPQFSSAQLARGALIHLFRATKEVKSDTFIACAKAVNKLGLYPLIGKRLFERTF